MVDVRVQLAQPSELHSAEQGDGGSASCTCWVSRAIQLSPLLTTKGCCGQCCQWMAAPGGTASNVMWIPPWLAVLAMGCSRLECAPCPAEFMRRQCSCNVACVGLQYHVTLLEWVAQDWYSGEQMFEDIEGYLAFLTFPCQGMEGLGYRSQVSYNRQ